MSNTTLKSSDARTGLPKLVGQVVDTGEDLLIEQNGEIVARLTTSRPGGAIRPMRITTVEAREGWSKFLDSVVRGAKWYFVLKRAPDTRVFLVRHKTYRNDFYDRWHAKVVKESAGAQGASTAEALRATQLEVAERVQSLRADLDGFQENLRLLSALVSRTGDLLANPHSSAAPKMPASDLPDFRDVDDA